MIRKVLLISLLVIGFQTAQAQHRCHMDEHFDPVGNELHMAGFEEHYVRQVQSATRLSGTKYTIPVVFHVIHDPADNVVGNGSNISDALIKQQVEILNQDYRKISGSRGDGKGVDTEIEFVLAQRDPNGNCTDGIVRVGNAVSVNYVDTTNALELRMKRLSYWNSKRYLNIWVVKSLYDGAFGVAHFPWDRNNGAIDDTLDGVTLVAGTIGENGDPNVGLGRTATHEVGHWLGLFHVFQGDTSNPCLNDTCLVRGDRVCDTPPQNGSTTLGTPCGSNKNTCNTDSLNGAAVSGFDSDQEDMLENYMDYSNDGCMDRFTAGQLARIQSTLTNTRTVLWSDTNLVFTGVKELPLAVLDSLADGLNGTVDAMVHWVAKKQLIVAGSFDSAGGIAVNGLAAWDGTNWSKLDSVPLPFKGQIRDMAIYKGELYVGGSFLHYGHFKHIARYDGTRWRNVTADDHPGWMEGPSHPVNALQVYQDKLYVGGDYGQLEHGVLNINASHIGTWDGSNWGQVGPAPYGVTGSSASVYALGLFKGDLIVAGRFTLAGNTVTSDKVIRWDGSAWHSMSTQTDPNGRINCLLAHKDRLYAGGDFFGLDTVGSGFVNYYENGSWYPTKGFGLDARSMAVYQGEVYVGGHIQNLGGPQYWNMVRWDEEEKEYENLSPDYNGPESTVHHMTEFKGQLYVGGPFAWVNGMNGAPRHESRNIFRMHLDCEESQPIGIGHSAASTTQIRIYPNPASTQVTIAFGQGDKSFVSLEVMDLYGHLIQKQALDTGKRCVVQVRNFPAGHYLLRLIAEDGSSTVKRFVKM